ncbi:flavin containing amine oxidoreductase [Coleophoma crateriformis]|uniref:Flavin containing amine oxidoreductase n=1 Tax=Coleophoma crateriformis TaxID=565419 RepID=A0A3D8QLL1_9HELO|nr:flavin containing amine oxidoreductase [Coleophoma crateriformis]
MPTQSLTQPVLRRTFSVSNPPHIGIIGAGVSGLRCADILLQNGFKVTILEARDRIGGRLCQKTLPSGQIVDLGANWIHGTDNNPILELAQLTNTETHSWPANSNLFADDGKLIAQDNANILGDQMWEIILDAFKFADKHTAEIDINESLYDFFCQKATELYPGSGEDEQRRKTLLQMSEMWGAFVGSPVTRQSLKFFWLEECLEGETLFCAGTYQKILAHISEPALGAADIKLSAKVTNIISGEDGTTVITDQLDEIKFDEIVVTAPLGWLKKNTNKFQPALPPRFLKAVDSIGYGCLEKAYINFPRAFWIKEGVDIAQQPFTGFGQWISPSYTPHTNPRRWNQEVVEMGTLPGATAHPTLLFYIFGEQSHALANEIAAISTQKERDEHIVKFFKPYYSLLPGYDESSPDCIPQSTLSTNWVLDDFAGNGSYCNFQVGVEAADKDIEVMREGLPERNLWFAGEHTSPYVALGTVTGAYWSGEAVGKRISLAYGKSNKTWDIPKGGSGKQEQGEISFRGPESALP